MHKIAIGFFSLLFLGVAVNSTAAQERSTAQPATEQFCDYTFVFDSCEGRADASVLVTQITTRDPLDVAIPEEKRVTDSTSPVR